MESVTKIVLAIPGTDDLQSGPEATWMEQIGANLELVLKKYTGESLKVISPGDKKADDLSPKPDYLILLNHVSYAPDGKYLKSLENIAGADGKGIKNIVRIDTSPETRENIPGLLEKAASIELFELQEGSDATDWIGEDNPTYWSRLLDVAVDIRDYLGAASKQIQTRGNMIYLAQAAADMGKNRNVLKRELMEHGFSILPDTDLKMYKKDIKSQVQSLVDKCQLAIHLIGNSYGEVLKESGSSLAEMQVQYITKYLEAIENDPVHSEKELNRLIWIDPDFNPVDSKQEEFINQLKRNIENLHRTEIIQTPLELFKTLVVRRLKHGAKEAKHSEIDTPANGKLIYLLHSGDDQKKASELARGLEEGGLKTGMLNYEKGQKKLLNDHKKYLRVCAGAVVFYGKENRLWLRSKVMDLLKAPGLGRKHPMEKRQILAGGKDGLDDFSVPREILVTREPDMSKAVSQLLKNLK